MAEAYSVIFNSQGTNVVVNNANNTSITYNVNWNAFLPMKFKKFHCQFIFKSQNYAGILVNNGFVNMNLGKVNVFDGTTMTSNLGIIYPVITNTTAGALASYYNSTNNDNNDFWIQYPTNQQVTINLNTFAGVAMANMPSYTLVLNLIGIE